jgi:hypothetical protein
MRTNMATRFAPVWGNDGNNCIFITREYDSFGLKENGTIPFYRRFFDRITSVTLDPIIQKPE